VIEELQMLGLERNKSRSMNASIRSSSP